jgi:hypothetical protein
LSAATSWRRNPRCGKSAAIRIIASLSPMNALFWRGYGRRWVSSPAAWHSRLWFLSFGPKPVRVGLAAFLLVMALVCAAGGYLRWERAERALRTNSPLHLGVLPRLVAVGVVAVVLVAMTVIVLGAAG